MASKDTGEIVEMNDGHREPLQRKSTDAYDRNADPGPGYITGGQDQDSNNGGLGCCGYILWFLSMLVVLLTLPVSLCLCIKVVQEYERAVIFRLGRLLSGGAKGPGL
ncbi:band 7 protein AAEL010189-like, partial [Ruditapes philippinarum]|uniref:band 7 protein AAEL010189-like n=1 Tax=Ruditapes philippinarum TaxID=129788 RepID=UPI00295BEEDD